MKKIIAILLALTMVFALCACGAKGPKGTYILYSDNNIEIGRLEFSGNKVVLVIGREEFGSVSRSEGTFTYQDGRINCIFDGENGDDGGKDDFTYNEETDTIDIYGIMEGRKAR